MGRYEWISGGRKTVEGTLAGFMSMGLFAGIRCRVECEYVDKYIWYVCMDMKYDASTRDESCHIMYHVFYLCFDVVMGLCNMTS